MTTEQTAPAEPIPTPRQSSDASRRHRGWLYFLRDVLVIVLIAILVSFLVKTFVVRSFYIPSGSMEDTLLVNDRILVDEITPRFGGYDRGQIIVFRDPGGWLPPSSEAGPPAGHRGRRLGARPRRPVCPGFGRPPRQAPHRAAR